MLLLVSAFALCGASLCYAYPDANLANRNTEHPILTTKLGPIEGTIIATRLGRKIHAFRGIRYGKAPINELRFMPAQPADKWEGTLNATLDAPLCPQPTVQPISEDCLFLNVYSPKIPKNQDKPKLPVIVFVHGLSGKTVGGASYLLGPQYLLDQDVVLVTFNYRFGTLGFLSTGDKEAPGNNGFKDQVLALKWVRQNIESFGGDPQSITLAGQDFGAVAVTLHLVSPMSRNLFHGAIAMSGSALGTHPLASNQLPLAKRQASLLKCPTDTPSAIVKCLRGKTYAEISDSYAKLREFGKHPTISWWPVIEADVGQERFLTGNPTQLLQTGAFTAVPFITGITTEEHACQAFGILNNDTLRKDFGTQSDKWWPVVLQYERDSEASKTITKALKTFYYNDKPIEKTSIASTVQLLSDGLTGFSVNRVAKLLAEKSNQSVYYYRFNYAGRNSHFYTPQSNNTEPFGVVHGDDLMYLFYIEKQFPFFKDTTPNDAETVAKLTALWANFARTKQPIPEPHEKLDNVKWEPFALKTQKFLDIANKLVLNEKLYDKRYNEWDKLFPAGGKQKPASG